jgi:hypothetical protein
MLKGMIMSHQSNLIKTVTVTEEKPTTDAKQDAVVVSETVVVAEKDEVKQ